MAVVINPQFSVPGQDAVQRGSYGQMGNVIQGQQPYVVNPHPVVFPTHGTRQDFVTTHVPIQSGAVYSGVPEQAHFGAISSDNNHWGVVLTPPQYEDWTPAINAFSQALAQGNSNRPVVRMQDVVGMMPKPRVPQRAASTVVQKSPTGNLDVKKETTVSTPKEQRFHYNGETRYWNPDYRIQFGVPNTPTDLNPMGAWGNLQNFSGYTVVPDGGLDGRKAVSFPLSTFTRELTDLMERDPARAQQIINWVSDKQGGGHIYSIDPYTGTVVLNDNRYGNGIYGVNNWLSQNKFTATPTTVPTPQEYRFHFNGGGGTDMTDISTSPLAQRFPVQNKDVFAPVDMGPFNTVPVRIPTALDASIEAMKQR